MTTPPHRDDDIHISNDTSLNFDTLAVHGGYDPESHTRCTAPPIYQTAGYTFEDSAHAADLFALKEPGHIYSRLDNPTNALLESRMSLLEGGVGALALASGLSAIMVATLTIARAGDEVIASSELYGGCFSLFAHTMSRLGIKVHFIPSHDLAQWEATINDKTKFLYTETIGNPKLHLADIGALAKVGQRHGLPLVVDNTMTTPYLMRPLEHGASIVIHSTTKYIGGHGAAMGGMIVDGGTFDWAGSGRFPELTEPEPSYHGLKFHDTFGKMAYIIRARATTLRDTGAIMAPFHAWQFLQGLETLSLRMARHCENAMKIATFLEQHPAVSWIHYPGLPSSPTYHLVNQYMPKGQGGMIGFGLKGGKDAGIAFINSVRIFANVANLGDAKSLVIHPASTTHAQLNPEEQEAAGVLPDFIRMSVGIEDGDDLIADLNQALAKVQAQFQNASSMEERPTAV